MLKQNSCSTKEQDKLIAKVEDAAKRGNGRIIKIKYRVTKIPKQGKELHGPWVKKQVNKTCHVWKQTK